VSIVKLYGTFTPDVLAEEVLVFFWRGRRCGHRGLVGLNAMGHDQTGSSSCKLGVVSLFEKLGKFAARKIPSIVESSTGGGASLAVCDKVRSEGIVHFAFSHARQILLEVN
jgi:hypothetical protein